MRKLASSGGLLFLVTLLLPAAASPQCSEAAVVHLVRAAMLSNAGVFVPGGIRVNDGGRLRDYVSQHRSFFSRNGAAVRCARLVGPRLQQMGVPQFDEYSVSSILESPTIGTLAPEFADIAMRDVSQRGFSAGNVILEQTGIQITWLGQVLPAVADGDLGPFLNTAYPLLAETRRMMPDFLRWCERNRRDCEEQTALAKRGVDEIATALMVYLILSAS